MKFYADAPAKRLRQVLVDLAVLAWVVVWVVVGMSVQDRTMRAMRAPSDRMHAAGTSLRDAMDQASGVALRIPVVGGELRVPFDRVARVGEDLRTTADDNIRSAQVYSRWLGVLVAALPLSVVLLLWGPARWRGARRLTTAARLARSSRNDDLLALRALLHQPPARLRAEVDDPVAAWRQGDADAIRRLARLELADAGIRRPRPARAVDHRGEDGRGGDRRGGNRRDANHRGGNRRDRRG